jgi:hypothetical protein
MTARRRALLTVGVAAFAAGAAAFWRYGRAVWYPALRAVAGKRAVEDILRGYGPAAEGRLRAPFEKAGVAYPPPRIALLAFKEEKRLELWAGKGKGWAFIRSYAILAASGKAGPKLRRGDRPVPEGLYRIEALNPNSSYHLSMKLDYPNADDCARAKEDGRADLGGDIMIHGKDVSIGCLAVGDPAIEELFVLAARVGIGNVAAIVAPCDLRGPGKAADTSGLPAWVPRLHGEIARALGDFPAARD